MTDYKYIKLLHREIICALIIALLFFVVGVCAVLFINLIFGAILLLASVVIYAPTISMKREAHELFLQWEKENSIK